MFSALAQTVDMRGLSRPYAARDLDIPVLDVKHCHCLRISISGRIGRR
jgi:hypothetical protein